VPSLKLPKELQKKQIKKDFIPLVPKKHDCPRCLVEIHWTPSNSPNIFLGVCPKCGMDFTLTNGNIIGGIKYSH
jgi:hypothetical protein